MKKNIKIILISIIALTIVYQPKIFAISKIADRTLITIEGQHVYKLYDNTVTGDIDYYSEVAAGKIKLNIDGEIKPGFCVDFGVDIYGNETKEYDTKEYFAKGIGDAEAEKLLKKLTEYVKFGYGSEGRNTDKYYLATQKLIWDAISDSGFYASDYYQELSKGAIGKLKLQNFRWTINNGKTVIDLSEEINDIQNSIKEYYKAPSFCSSQEKIEIEVGETAEYTDNNNVLTKFEVKCENGIECQVDGNKLKVTAGEETSNHKITFTKTDSNKTNSYIYKHGSEQGVIAESGTLEPVSCEFGIDTFKNEKTADIKIIYIITIGLFCGVMAYITYYTKKSLDELN